MMNTIDRIQKMQELAEQTRAKGLKIGLVPTMGFLHEGHLSLIRLARSEADFVVVSIFVNPTQFGPGEDYQAYPRDLRRDSRLIAQSGGDVVFAPTPEEMYPFGYRTFVEVEGITKKLCGAFRPTHFRGVATVVTKLFCIIRPHFAVFGQKDAQQTIVIKSLARDLNLDTKIMVAPTVREPDGLAMSSRNLYLSPQEREDAPVLYSSLETAESMVKAGEHNASRIIECIKKIISEKPSARIEYVNIVDTETLDPKEELSGEVLIALAARFGRARLIDNIILRV